MLSPCQNGTGDSGDTTETLGAKERGGREAGEQGYLKTQAALS